MDCDRSPPFGQKLTLASASFSRNETESTLTSMACTSTFFEMSLITPSFTASDVSMFFEQPARDSAARQIAANFTYRLYPPCQKRLDQAGDRVNRCLDRNRNSVLAESCGGDGTDAGA